MVHSVSSTMPYGLNIDDKIHELNLGKSFGSKPRFCFHSVRYDFKPASIDRNQKSLIQVGQGNSLSVSVPHIGGIESTIFKGNKKQTPKECILIIDNITGEITIEKINSTMHLKKTRSEKPQAFIEKSVSTPEKLNKQPPLASTTTMTPSPISLDRSPVPMLPLSSNTPTITPTPTPNAINTAMPYRTQPVLKSAVKPPCNNNNNTDSSSCSENSSSSSSDSSSEEEDESANQSLTMGSSSSMVSMPSFEGQSPMQAANHYNQNVKNPSNDVIESSNSNGANTMGMPYTNNMLSQDLCLSECSSSDDD